MRRYIVALNEEHCQKAMTQIADAPPPAVVSRAGSLQHTGARVVEKPTIPLLLMGFPGPNPAITDPEIAGAGLRHLSAF